ncbi:unnamed protein product [Polarella glacialis]|uniref:Uncharacterized protein n=1 Tax=Polarella glacialis TaxID=89957 RepID=A0A813J358_POLGL|nr:unnamed protein product [Polarella glacialis]
MSLQSSSLPQEQLVCLPCPTPQRGLLASPRFFAGPSEARARLRERSARTDFSAEIKREAHRLLNPQGSGPSRTSVSSSFSERSSAPPSQVRHDAGGTQEERYGGSEAMPLEVMEAVTASGAMASATFTQAGMQPRRVSRKTKLPGQTPWTAFEWGTKVIILLWGLSTLWAIFIAVNGGWKREHPEQKPEVRIQAATSLLRPSDFAPLPGAESGPGLLWRALCPGHLSSAQQSQQGQLVQNGWRRLSSHWALADGHAVSVVVDFGCGLRQPWLDLSVTCPPGNSSGCIAVLLRRGGRLSSVCRLRRRGRALVLSPLASLRLAPGVPSLQGLAAGLRRRGARVQDLQLFGRTAHTASRVHDDSLRWDVLQRQHLQRLKEEDTRQTEDPGESLIALRLQNPKLTRGLERSFTLVPEFEVETSPAISVGAKSSSVPRKSHERLLVAGSALLSLVPTEDEDLEGEGSTCSFQDRQVPSLRLRAWDLVTGEIALHWIPLPAAPPQWSTEIAGLRQRPPATFARHLGAMLCERHTAETEA